MHHLIKTLDGPHHSPSGLPGPIGKRVLNCETEPVIEFHSISSEDIAMKEQVLKDLSTDQKYMFEIFQAIKNGSCSTSLACQKPWQAQRSKMAYHSQPIPKAIYLH